ncbi:molecular chaperone DnaK [Helicobacter pylori]|nr:molecular chaperone DnaK [Helicobacter pylori]
MIIKIAQSQEVGLETPKTQILHENINKSGYKNLKSETCKNKRYAHYP